MPMKTRKPSRSVRRLIEGYLRCSAADVPLCQKCEYAAYAMTASLRFALRNGGPDIREAIRELRERAR